MKSIEVSDWLLFREINSNFQLEKLLRLNFLLNSTIKTLKKWQSIYRKVKKLTLA